MLGKLIKYEIKNSYKLILMMFGIFVLFTIFACFSATQFGNAIINDDVPKVVSFVILLLYIMAVYALFLVTFIYQCIRFYKTMYSEQGYLTHTLPVSTISIFNTKLIASVVWILCAVIVVGLSFLCIGFTLSSSLDYSFKDLMGGLYEEFFETMWMTGINSRLFFVLSGVCTFLGLFFPSLWIYTSMAVGQLGNEHRTLLSIGAAFGIYMLNQIFSTSFFSIKFLFEFNDIESPIEVGNMLTNFFGSIIVYLLIVDVALYALSLFINTKKLNLQ